MLKRQRRYSSDDLARRGGELYESKIRPVVEAENIGRILCIDIESGDYALADEPREATMELIDKNPDAQIWCLRIGHIAVDKFAGGDTREKR
jgi:hypothetical protein